MQRGDRGVIVCKGVWADPSHGCFTHDEVVSPRLETSPMSMKVTEPVSKQGYTLWHGGYTNVQKKLEMTSSRTFAAPGIIQCASIPYTPAYTPGFRGGFRFERGTVPLATTQDAAAALASTRK